MTREIDLELVVRATNAQRGLHPGVPWVMLFTQELKHLTGTSGPWMINRSGYVWAPDE